jgi:tetratricopeptide (TPR) repeat protein
MAKTKKALTVVGGGYAMQPEAKARQLSGRRRLALLRSGNNPMIVICPNCAKRHKLPEDWSANKVRCSRCGEKFFLDELDTKFMVAETNGHQEARESQKAAPSIRENSRHSRLPVWSSLRLVVGIAAVLVIAGTAAFYFLHVLPENKFHQAMREGQEAENAERWNDAVNSYFRAEQLKPHDLYVTGAWQRVLEKQRLAEYAEAMERGNAAEQSGNWDIALREYQTALARRADDADAKDGIRRVQYGLHMKEAREAERQKRWGAALIAYSHALAAKPGDADATSAMRRVEYHCCNGARTECRSFAEMGRGCDGLQKSMAFEAE